MKLNKALENRTGEVLEKAKYTKRTGTPGHYKYEYGTPKSKGRQAIEKRTGKTETMATTVMGDISAKDYQAIQRRKKEKRKEKKSPDFKEGDYISKEGKHYTGQMAIDKRTEDKTKTPKKESASTEEKMMPKELVADVESAVDAAQDAYWDVYEGNENNEEAAQDAYWDYIGNNAPMKEEFEDEILKITSKGLPSNAPSPLSTEEKPKSEYMKQRTEEKEKKKSSNQEKMVNEYHSKLQEVSKVMNQVNKGLRKRQELDRNKINYSHIGDIGHIQELLKELERFI
jgi:hypothetical protein